ncbi:MAG TPA: outer membrane protein assembly factor BamA [Desulfobacterales bacterium]|nr:outer membrane protein assembly factor BamA [Desulfobacterales bacterium]
MQKRWWLLVISIWCCFPSSVSSFETVRVVVLPFEILARENLSYLRDELPGIIQKHLEQEGAVIIEPDERKDASREKTFKSTEEIRAIGLKNGAEYVVWGSLTWIGRKFSLDAKMIESLEKKPPQVFFEEGENIENLLGIVKKLAGDIGIKLFKQEKVAGMKVVGNQRIESDAVEKVVKTKPGDIYSPKNLSEDLKRIYSMGYFEDVRIEMESKPDGKTVIFRVTEKPTIRVIRFKGNRTFEDKELLESMDIKTGSILNISKINSNIKRMEELYKDKNFHNVTVVYNVRQLEKNQADLEFEIEEGEKVRIKSITFIGNSAYNDKKLKGIMKSSEKGFFSWLTSAGDLNREDLNQDVGKLSAFYQNSGYIQARVGEPEVEFKDDWIDITIKIDEGPRFAVGRVDVAGDLVLPRDELLKNLKIGKEEFFNREIVRNDVLLLTDLYSDKGYAYADITPGIDRDFDERLVHITYSIQKGNQVTYEKILIAGNTKTRDKVIRRELRVYEQELYSGKELKRSIRNLHRLDYFEDIKVDTSKGSSDDTMALKIEVTEKPTGVFTFGAGYSSVENVFGMASISQRNLFGRGQTLQLRGQVGSRTTQFVLSFLEPWLFDIPLSAKTDLYNWIREYDDYDRDSKGGTLQLGYPVYDFTRVYLSYTYDIADITDIEEDAAKSIKELEGTNVTSSVSTMLTYDSRDRLFNTTEGQNHSVTVEYAGLGGDIGFTKYTGKVGWYIPLFLGTVGFLHGEAGYVAENGNGILPDYERFYLGGINSLRGFDFQDICVRDDEGDEIGGDKYIQFNLEYMFPLVKQAGVSGVIFYDTGNVYGVNQSIDLGNLRKSAGVGIRWYSPVGPIRIEYGYILDRKEDDTRSGRVEFSMGTGF